ncbi:hypothetical protein JR338_03880 [Chloroflexota bacterium]|nr:hypothetical protein JR338_03880 [Chloroflexota bacterium]
MKKLLPIIFVLLCVSCDQVIGSEEKTTSPGAPEQVPSATSTLTPTMFVESPEDRFISYADIVADELPECNVSINTLSTIDLTQFTIQSEDIDIDFLSTEIDHLVLNDVTDQMGRILILEKDNDGNWTAVTTIEKPYPLYVVSVSPSGKYLLLLFQTDTNSQQTALFDVDQLEIISTSNEVRLISGLGWSADESKLIVPLKWDSIDPDPAAGIAEIYEIPSLEHKKTVNWPDDPLWIEYGFWISPALGEEEKFLFRTLTGVYLYEGDDIEAVNGLNTRDYNFNIHVAWLDGDKYAASYLEKNSFGGEDYWINKLGIFEDAQQLADYTVQFSSTLGYSSVSYLEYDPNVHEMTLVSPHTDTILRFELVDQTLKNHCQVDIKELIGQLDPSILEKRLVDPLFLSDDIFYIYNDSDEIITVYQIVWVP